MNPAVEHCTAVQVTAIQKLASKSRVKGSMRWLTAALLFALANTSIASPESELQAFSEKVEGDLVKGHFESLDATADRLRDPNVRFPGGNSQLYHFYTALAAYAGREHYDYTSAIPFDAKRALLERWAASSPKSTAPRVALAQLWLFAAWRARGEGYAEKVTPQQWQAFFEDLAKGDKWLEGIDPKVSPHLYWLLIEMSRGRKERVASVAALYQDAIGQYPSYFHYYPQRAEWLQERWYGRPGDLKAYLEDLAVHPGGTEGLVAYSYAALRLLGFYSQQSLFQSTGLTWQRVQLGYQAREQRYGLRNKDWNALLRFAVAANDRAAAKQALQKISDWDRHIWIDRKYFDAAAGWAAPPN